MATTSNKKLGATELEDIPFPPGSAKPHKIERWIKWKHAAQVDKGVNDIAHGRIPDGMFPPLWSRAACEDPPDLPEGASWSDQARYKTMLVQAQRRKDENAKTIAERNEWRRSGNNVYFQSSISASSVKTRRAARARAHDAGA